MLSQRAMTMALLALMLMGGMLTAAQGGPAWQVETAEALTLPSSVGLRIFPAPDGHTFGFESAVKLNGHIDRFLCASDSLTAEEPLCLEPPEALPRGFDPDTGSHFTPVSWSPDSTKLAVVGQPLSTGSDTDLWIMDLASASWTSLTDDSYEGPLLASEDSDGPPAGVSIEVQPAWSPDGTQIAVERTLIGDGDGDGGLFAHSTLSLVDVTTHEITDLTLLPGHETSEQDAGSTTSIAWSPDGTTLAISLRHREPDPDNDGVWLVDVDSGDLMHLVSVPDVEGMVHEVYSEVTPDSIGPVSWSPDGQHLLFWAGNVSSRPIAVWAFWVNVENHEITPLPLPSHPNDTGARRLIWPMQAAWSPDGSALIVAANGSHPDETVISLDPASRRARVSLRLVDLAKAESELLGGLPAGLAVPLYFATWGPDGDVLLNGHHLELTTE